MNEQIFHTALDAKERGERLRRLRNLANVSRKILCDEANININTYIGYEVGRYGGLTTKGSEKIIQYLCSKGVYCSLNWLMNGNGDTPRVVTNIKLNPDEDTPIPFADTTNETQKITDELQLFYEHYKNSVDYRIIDDGMFPVYEVGDVVAGVSYIGSSIDSIIGYDCIVQIEYGEMLVRNLRKGRIENSYILTCTNPKTQVISPIIYDVNLVFAARIIWHRSVYINTAKGDKDISC